MDAQGGVFSQGETIIFPGQALFVQCVTSLMNTTPCHMAEVVLIDAGGDPDIFGTKAGGERVLGNILTACLEIETHLPDQVNAEIPLLLLRERWRRHTGFGRRGEMKVGCEVRRPGPLFGPFAAQEAIIRGSLRKNAIEQILQGRADLVEYFVQQGYSTTLFELIDQRIIRMLFISGQFGFLSFQCYEALQIAGVDGEGIRSAGTDPRVKAFRAGLA